MSIYIDRIVPILRASVERNAGCVWLLGGAIPVMRPAGATDSRGDIRMADFEAVSEADLHTFLVEIGIQMDAGNRYGRLGSSFRVHASWSAGQLSVDFRILGESAPGQQSAGTAVQRRSELAAHMIPERGKSPHDEEDPMADAPNISAYEAGIRAETEALFRAFRPDASECASPDPAYWRDKVMANRAAAEAGSSS